jgi:hypothetical protein
VIPPDGQASPLLRTARTRSRISRVPLPGTPMIAKLGAPGLMVAWTWMISAWMPVITAP